MKIAMIAPPWLSLYPGCYYGIENVVHNLTTALYEDGHEVVLFTVGDSTTSASARYWYYKEGQYKYIHRPWYQVLPITSAHVIHALNIIREIGDFDIIHDHNSYTGPSVMAYADRDFPPILHTLHEPFTNKERRQQKNVPDNRALFKELRHTNKMYFTGVSRSQLKTLPKQLSERMVQVVHNGVNLNDYIYSKKKQDYFINVGRIGPDKGQGTAAKLCHELGEKLKFAGTIGGEITSKRQLESVLDSTNGTTAKSAEFLYYRDKVMPYLTPKRIEYIGTVFGERKMKLLSKAKGFLAPIAWDEPFGIAIVDALACGTPVVAYRRGAFSEIIEHGKNGFLADTEQEFKQYMKRIDEIDPEACRRSVEKKFSAEKMAHEYVKRYEEVIAKAKSA